MRPRHTTPPPDSATLDRVQDLLIVRAHDQLGDFLIATPAIAALRRRFAGAHITLVVNEFLAPLALNNPDVDRVLVAPWKKSPRNLGQLYQLQRELKTRTYDLAIVLNTVSHSLTSDVIARLSGARLVTGPEHPKLKDQPGAPLFDWSYRLEQPVGMHQMDRAVASVVPLGCDAHMAGYRFALKPEEHEVGIRLRNALPRAPLIALHVGTKDPEKQYPAEQWVEAAESVSERTEAHLVLLDAPDARDTVRNIAARIGAPHTTLKALTLRELASTLEQMDLLLCHDSAILHLAAAVGTPTVSIHGRGRLEAWKPNGERHVALQAADSIPSSISSKTVADAVAKLWSHLASASAKPESQPAGSPD